MNALLCARLYAHLHHQDPRTGMCKPREHSHQRGPTLPLALDMFWVY